MNDLVDQTNRKLSYPGQQVSTVGLCAKVEAMVCYEAGFQRSRSVAAWYASTKVMQNSAVLFSVWPKKKFLKSGLFARQAQKMTIV